MESLEPTNKFVRRYPGRQLSSTPSADFCGRRESRNTTRQNHKKSTTMEDLIDRIISGRIFKQIADYAYGRRAPDESARLDTCSSSTFQNAEDCLLPQADISEGHRLTKSVVPLASSADVEMLPAVDKSPVENIAACDMDPDHGIPHFHTVDYSTGIGKLPLTARYAEVFTFIGKDNEMQTGVSLTEAIVWQLNVVLQGEQRTAGIGLESMLSRVSEQEYREDITDINNQLEDLPEGFQDSPALLEAVLKDQEELDSLTHLSEELALEIQSLEGLIKKVHEGTRCAKNLLFSDLKETLAEGGLLEPFVEEVETQLPALQRTNPTGVQTQARPTPTPSEAERYAVEDAREAALQDITRKTIQVQDAQERFDNLVNHYNEQYDNFNAGVEHGTISASKSEFDCAMLLDSREATTMLIQAEEELEQVRDHARELGLTLSSYDQESCFVDYLDDGYRESLENEWVTHVDRGRIERWMASEDGTPEEIECDEWDWKTVDISDSVSAVADTPKSRRRIDYWKSICENLDVKMTDQASLDCEMTDF